MSTCENCGLPITAEHPGSSAGTYHRALLVAFTAAQAENERLRAMLRQLEWVMPREGWVMLYMAPKYCQICGKYRHQGHAPDCKLAVALGANAA